MNRRSLIYVWLVLLGFLSWHVKGSLDSHIKTRETQDIRYLPSPQLANILAFGFKPALADIYWIQGINYFGEQLLNKKRTYVYLESYTDLISSLDPYFTAFYDWAATTFIYNGLKITRENVIKSTHYINQGIQRLHEVRRYDRNMIIKGAFNYAIETNYRKSSVPYFELAARTFSSERDMLLVASTYAFHENEIVLASALKLEYLATMAFEAQTKQEVDYALHVISSPRMNVQAGEFVKALRIKMETEEDVRKLVEKRLSDSPLQRQTNNNPLPADPRIENTLRIELSRTWMPPDMLALFSL